MSNIVVTLIILWFLWESMAHHIHPIPGDLYRKTAPIQEDMPKVQGYNFNQGVDHRAMLQSYLNTGLQATNVGKAIQQINKMVRRAVHREN